MQGFDAAKVEYQRKGVATWENIGFLTKTAGGLQITPAVPDSAEMGMVRCVFVAKKRDHRQLLAQLPSNHQLNR